MLLPHFIGKGSLKLEPLVMLDTCNRIGHPSILSLPSCLIRLLLILQVSFTWALPGFALWMQPLCSISPFFSFIELLSYQLYLPPPLSLFFSVSSEKRNGYGSPRGRKAMWLLPLMLVFHWSFKDAEIENISATRHVALSFCFCFVILYSDRY